MNRVQGNKTGLGVGGIKYKNYNSAQHLQKKRKYDPIVSLKHFSPQNKKFKLCQVDVNENQVLYNMQPKRIN